MRQINRVAFRLSAALSLFAASTTSYAQSIPWRGNVDFIGQAYFVLIEAARDAAGQPDSQRRLFVVCFTIAP
jgi:hypothetical protein